MPQPILLTSGDEPVSSWRSGPICRQTSTKPARCRRGMIKALQVSNLNISSGALPAKTLRNIAKCVIVDFAGVCATGCSDIVSIETHEPVNPILQHLGVYIQEYTQAQNACILYTYIHAYIYICIPYKQAVKSLATVQKITCDYKKNHLRLQKNHLRLFPPNLACHRSQNALKPSIFPRTGVQITCDYFFCLPKTIKSLVTT